MANEAGLMAVREAVAREIATGAICVRREHFLAAPRKADRQPPRLPSPASPVWARVLRQQ